MNDLSEVIQRRHDARGEHPVRAAYARGEHPVRAVIRHPWPGSAAERQGAAIHAGRRGR